MPHEEVKSGARGQYVLHCFDRAVLLKLGLSQCDFFKTWSFRRCCVFVFDALGIFDKTLF